MTKFFTLLKTLYDKIKYPAHRIFNVDETSLSTVPGKNCKVLAQRGRKQVGRVVSTIAVNCMSASGSYIPPMVIFARKRMKKELDHHREQHSIAMILVGCNLRFLRCGLTIFFPLLSLHKRMLHF